MTYTGAVTVGGPADVRELPTVTITKVAVGPMDNNAYLLRCTRTGEQLLLDAANEAGRLLELLGGAPLGTVVTSHRHADHWQALAEVAGRTGAGTLGHPLDAPELPVPPTRTVGHGDTVAVGDVELTVLHLRGHTPGSIALHHETAQDGSHLFVADSLFPGGPGNTQRDPRRFGALMDDLQSRVFDVLPDETWVYPGHGKDTTLGTERPHLPEWRARGW